VGRPPYTESVVWAGEGGAAAVKPAAVGLAAIGLAGVEWAAVEPGATYPFSLPVKGTVYAVKRAAISATNEFTSGFVGSPNFARTSINDATVFSRRVTWLWRVSTWGLEAKGAVGLGHLERR